MYHVMRSTSELINVWMIFTLKMFGCLELQAFKHKTAGVTMPRREQQGVLGNYHTFHVTFLDMSLLLLCQYVYNNCISDTYFLKLNRNNFLAANIFFQRFRETEIEEDLSYEVEKQMEYITIFYILQYNNYDYAWRMGNEHSITTNTGAFTKFQYCTGLNKVKPADLIYC